MQVTKIETKKKLKIIELQTDVLKTSKKKFALTESEIERMEPETKYGLAAAAKFQW